MIYLKRMTTIRINPQILKRAQELGLNISQFCENALKIGIEALENANQKIASNQTATAKGGSAETPTGFSQVDRGGFEPPTSRVQVGRSYQTELPAHAFYSLFEFWG